LENLFNQSVKLTRSQIQQRVREYFEHSGEWDAEFDEIVKGPTLLCMLDKDFRLPTERRSSSDLCYSEPRPRNTDVFGYMYYEVSQCYFDKLRKGEMVLMAKPNDGISIPDILEWDANEKRKKQY
jgi:hypothetical protein